MLGFQVTWKLYQKSGLHCLSSEMLQRILKSMEFLFSICQQNFSSVDCLQSGELGEVPFSRWDKWGPEERINSGRDLIFSMLSKSFRAFTHTLHPLPFLPSYGRSCPESNINVCIHSRDCDFVSKDPMCTHTAPRSQTPTGSSLPTGRWSLWVDGPWIACGTTSSDLLV